MRDVLDAVNADADAAATRQAANRAKAPCFAAAVDKLKALYGDDNVRVKWIVTPEGECIGPVPAEIRANVLHGIGEG